MKFVMYSRPCEVKYIYHMTKLTADVCVGGAGFLSKFFMSS